MKTIILLLPFALIACKGPDKEAQNETINQDEEKLKALEHKKDSLAKYKKRVLESMHLELLKIEAAN